jgi:hypothetical protein
MESRYKYTILFAGLFLIFFLALYTSRIETARLELQRYNKLDEADKTFAEATRQLEGLPAVPTGVAAPEDVEHVALGSLVSGLLLLSLVLTDFFTVHGRSRVIPFEGYVIVFGGTLFSVVLWIAGKAGFAGIACVLTVGLFLLNLFWEEIQESRSNKDRPSPPKGSAYTGKIKK